MLARTARQLALASALVLALLAPHVAAEPAVGRWTAAVPDAWIDLSLRAAEAGGDDALARAVLIHSLDSLATAGAARQALARLARGDAPLAHEARWLRATLEPTDSPALGAGGESREGNTAGLVQNFAVIGPFQDSGGGLGKKEGPEQTEHRFATSRYSRGVYAVRTVRSLAASSGARGVPLDLYVHPRQESCTYLASAVRVPKAEPLVLRVAASGSFRLLWDGHDVLSASDVHQRLLLDRAAVRVEATAGEHLITLKSCTGARPDEGRVRIRVTDERGRDRALASSSEPAHLDRIAASLTGRAAPRFERVRTPLEQALADADRTSARALSAALLYRLAGADDLRSAKAPGLLDRVVADPAISADHLALAGYLAPFGANASGWLSRALARAKQTGDAETAAFAQRALVATRMEAKLGDLARSTAAEAPLAAANDPHARWLKAQTLAIARAGGAQAAAVRELLAIAGELGARTPLVVWRSIAGLSGSDHPARTLEARKRLADQLVSERNPQLLAAYRMMGAGTLEAMALRLAPQQDSAADLLRIGETLRDAGRYPAAERVLALTAELSPNVARVHAALARVRSLLGRDNAVDSLARAVELEPRDAARRAELDFRRGKRDEGPEVGEDARYLVEPEIFLERAKRQPAPADGMFERQLHWRRVVRYHPDRRVSQLMHYAREVLIEPRTENERYEDLPEGYASELLIARVHKKDGTVAAPEEQDSSGPSVRWPKLERGDVVEVAVRSWTPGPVGRRGDPPFFFVDYVGSTATRPVLYNDVILDAPQSAPLAFDLIGGKPDEQTTSTEGDRRITKLVYTSPVSIPDEPWSPPLSELVPVVVGSVYNGWDEFLEWYRGAVDGFTTPDEQIKRLAAELTDGKTSRDQKVAALFDFVADDIRYVNYVSGEWWLPNRPQQLLARRQGDCDDKAMLLISLLRAVGIEAKEVLIQTRMTRQRAVMKSSKVAIPLFDHGIVFLPDESGTGGRFLDATSPQSRVGTLPSMDAGAMALLVEDRARIIETPAAASSEHGVSAHWTLSLETDGGGSVKADERHFGDSAFRLRNHLLEEDARAQWIEQNLAGGWFPSLEVDPKVDFDASLPGGQARVGYRLRSRSLARREGEDLVVAIAAPMSLTGMLAPLTTRRLPVELPPGIAPQHRDMKLTIRAPASHRFADLPPDGEADGGDLGRARLRFTLSADKRSLTVEHSLALDAYRIEPADYPRWRSWLQSVDRLLQRSVRLVKR